jgi:very-short-patch-repair endonuclease
MKKIPKSVSDVLNKCSDVVGSYEQEMFNMDTYYETFEYLGTGSGKISPIEQILYVAMKTVFHVMSESPSDAVYDKHGNDAHSHGYDIRPQVKIGKYRVDFLVGCIGVANSKIYNREVIVECDGHNFHDKDKKQRAYEKARDRYFQSEGLTVFHYTGAEIAGNPIDAASEIVSFLIGKPKEKIVDKYSIFSGEDF